MKHHLLKITCAFALLCCTLISVNSQNAPSATLKFFEDEVCFGGAFFGVSPNGEYAVGHSSDFTGQSFLWSRKTGKLTTITGSLDDESEAYDVSNDGTVVGVFNDPVTKKTIPGFWKKGVWTVLPRIEGVGLVGSMMDGEANSISADGTLIGGNLYRGGAKYQPVMWKKGALSDKYDGCDLGQGGKGNSFSEDGTISGGWAEHDNGSRGPAVWIDGKMKRIEGLVDGGEFFFEGMVAKISMNGKYAVGYFSENGGGMDAKPFVWTKEDGFSYFAESGIASFVLDNGTIYGSFGYMAPAFIYKNGEMNDFSSYLDLNYNLNSSHSNYDIGAPLGVSADGKIVAGWGTRVVDGMGAIMIPYVVVMNGSLVGLEDNALATISVSLNSLAHQLNIQGTYTSADVYNSVGSCVLSDRQANGAIDVSSLINGVYFVKVVNADQIHTFKVLVRN